MPFHSGDLLLGAGIVGVSAALHLQAQGQAFAVSPSPSRRRSPFRLRAISLCTWNDPFLPDSDRAQGGAVGALSAQLRPRSATGAFSRTRSSSGGRLRWGVNRRRSDLRPAKFSFKRKADRKALSRMDAREPRNRPPRHEPMFDAPRVVVALALLFIAIFAAYSWARPEIQDLVIRDFAFVPGRLTVSYWPARAIDLLVRANADPQALEQARAMRDLHALSGGAQTVDASDLCLPSWLVDPCRSQHDLAHRLRAAGCAPLRRAAVPRLHGPDRDRQRAGALGERADGFRAAYRRLGLGVRIDGRRDPVHVSAWGASRTAGLRQAGRYRSGSGRYPQGHPRRVPHPHFPRASGSRRISSSGPLRKSSVSPTCRWPGSPMSAASPRASSCSGCSTRRRAWRERPAISSSGSVETRAEGPVDGRPAQGAGRRDGGGGARPHLVISVGPAGGAAAGSRHGVSRIAPPSCYSA